jgi:hypothetical protein
MVTPQIETSRRAAIDQILESRITQYGKGKPSPRWFEFGFPLRFDSDVLEVLELLTPYVSPDHEAIQDGLALVMEKQGLDGRWPCEKEPKGGRWMNKFVELEEIGQPSKWVTLHVLNMLKTLYSDGSNRAG